MQLGRRQFEVLD